MGLITSKKGFVFSFFVFFLIIVVFAFLSLTFNDDIYNTGTDFEVSRTLSLNDQVIYFRDSYVQDSLRFSLYMSLKGLIYELNQSEELRSDLNMNHRLLNSFILEALTNETINSSSNMYLENISLYNMTLRFRENFATNHRGTIQVNLTDLNLFEVNPYRVVAQMHLTYNITTSDQISSWDFEEVVFISTSVFDLKDPSLFMSSFRDEVLFFPTISPVERLRGNFNWNHDTFNQTLINSFQTIYFDPFFKYTLGNSFLSSLLNHSRSSYKNVFGFWSFDYDIEQNQIYDTTQNNNLNNLHVGNSIMLMSFNFNQTHFLDSSFQGNHFERDTVSNTSIGCIRQNCVFLSSGQSLSTSLSGFNSSKFSVSLWVNPQQNQTTIFTLDNLVLAINSDSRLTLSDGSVTDTSQQVLDLGRWTHISVSYNGEEVSVYSNNRLIIRNDMFSLSSISSNPTFTLGGSGFTGNFDEIAIYLSPLISELNTLVFQERMAYPIDYRDSLFGKGLYFNGINNLLNLSGVNFSTIDDQFTLEVWFKPFRTDTNFTLLRSDIFHIGVNTSLCSGNFSVTFNADHLCLIEMDELSNRWVYLVITLDSSNLFSAYINTIQVANSTLGFEVTFDNSDLIIGSLAGDFFFNGIIDELKLYNESLSPELITMHYFNYAGLAKGCCNYFSLINLNDLFISPADFSLIVSSSLQSFMSTYEENNPWTVTLYSIDNFTSTTPGEDYFNLFADWCILEIYNIFSWGRASPVSGTENPEFLSCRDLIRAGLY